MEDVLWTMEKYDLYHFMWPLAALWACIAMSERSELLAMSE
jgi:hypothetical protein